MEIEKQYVTTVWTKDFIFLCLSYFSLFFSFYVLLPVFPFYLEEKFGISLLKAGGITIIYILPLLLMGPFYSYLIDNYKRKLICCLAILMCTFCSGGYVIGNSLLGIILFRIIHGGVLGIANSLHTTLAIDLTLSNKRTYANCCHYKWAYSGMLLGIVGGIAVYHFFPIDFVFYIAFFTTILSLLFLLRVGIAFRAPIGSKLVSLDRFLLPKAFLAMLNFVFIAFSQGLLISYINIFPQTDLFIEKNILLFISIFLGSVFSWLSREVVKKEFDFNFSITVGLFLWIASFLLLIYDFSFITILISGILWGWGITSISLNFFLIFIGLSDHCQRGTSINTYEIVWQTGLVLGMYAGYLLISYHIENLIFIIGLIALIFTWFIYKNCQKKGIHKCN